MLLKYKPGEQIWNEHSYGVLSITREWEVHRKGGDGNYYPFGICTKDITTLWIFKPVVENRFGYPVYAPTFNELKRRLRRYFGGEITQ